MNADHRDGLGAAVDALRHDARIAVPQELELHLVSAFRAHHALVALGHDEEAVVPPALEATLVAAFREHRADQAAIGRRLRRLPWFLTRAAVLIAAVGGAVYFTAWPARNGSSTLPRTAVTAVAASSAHVPLSDAATRAVRPVTIHASVTPTRHLARVAPLPGRAIGAASISSPAPALEDDDASNDEFIPLTYVAGSFGDETHVVSVDVPRSALLDFGVQTEAVPDDATPVRAEVLMSEDGMPRGIRFSDRVPALARPPGSSRAPLTSRRRLQP